ncbi:MAG: hypothetical protein JKY96_01495 [Phycisphaerales bacterium]|nr:hypothetical protein [Phycisphaerales bacterium]
MLETHEHLSSIDQQVLARTGLWSDAALQRVYGKTAKDILNQDALARLNGALPPILIKATKTKQLMALRDHLRPLVEFVCDAYNLDPAEVMTRTDSIEYQAPRNEVCYLCSWSCEKQSSANLATAINVTTRSFNVAVTAFCDAAGIPLPESMYLAQAPIIPARRN